MDKKQKRREYQKRYYEANRDKALAYQRDYTKRHKKHKKSKVTTKRELRTSAFNHSDLMWMPTNKFAESVNRITAGDAVMSPT
jgi:hypothetical protein